MIFFDEQLAVGTAECIRDAAGSEDDALVLVLPASMVDPPTIDTLINAHRDGGSDLTVMLSPDYGNDKMPGKVVGIYVCNSRFLQCIPRTGYFDIKGGLIPEMLCAGKTIHIAVLLNHVGNFRDWRGYMHAIADYLENPPKLNAALKSASVSVHKPYEWQLIPECVSLRN